MADIVIGGLIAAAILFIIIRAVRHRKHSGCSLCASCGRCPGTRRRSQ